MHLILLSYVLLAKEVFLTTTQYSITLTRQFVKKMNNYIPETNNNIPCCVCNQPILHPVAKSSCSKCGALAHPNCRGILLGSDKPWRCPKCSEELTGFMNNMRVSSVKDLDIDYLFEKIYDNGKK